MPNARQKGSTTATMPLQNHDLSVFAGRVAGAVSALRITLGVMAANEDPCGPAAACRVAELALATVEAGANAAAEDRSWSEERDPLGPGMEDPRVVTITHREVI